MHESPWPSENPAPAGRHFRRKPSIDWALVIIIVGVTAVLLGTGAGMVAVTASALDVVGQIGEALTGALSRKNS